MTDQSEQFDQLPDAIIERLRACDRGISILTAEVDRAVNSAANAQFMPHHSASARRRWFYPAAAAAAAAVVALVIARPFGDSSPVGRFTTDDEQFSVSESLLADDVDGSGQVDILDAFALARSRRDDSAVISQARIDLLTDRIVSIGQPELAL